MKRGRLVILLVEDDDNDIYFVRHGVQTGGGGHELYAVHNGEEAIRYLSRQVPFDDHQQFPTPNVVLTDLKMPQMGGFDLLRWVRSHPECAIIPTIVYSSSHLESDVRQAYALGANSFITKPTRLNEMVEVLRAIYEYWSRCEIPVTDTLEHSP